MDESNVVYEVVVTTIGRIYQGTESYIAFAIYNDSVWRSKFAHGSDRYGASVMLYENGELSDQHRGTIERDSRLGGFDD